MRKLDLVLVALSAPFLFAGTAGAQTLTDAELDGKKFMHSKTFEGAGSGGWARDDIEIEGVFGVGGLDAKTLYRWLRAAPETREPLRGSLFSDANNYRELRRSSNCEAFSIGFPIDEIPWDADKHRVREDNPLVWVAIESDRFAIDERRNRRVLSLGADLMDDVYYDTAAFQLLGEKMSIRGRKRWDSPTEARRILIGLKRDGDVDGSGLKSVAKTDIRNDGASPAEIAQLDDAVRAGFTEWGTREPAVPVRELYERLRTRGVLPSSPGFKDVLLLEAKLLVRSIRSRYHLNEVSLSALTSLHKLGIERMNAIVALATAARTAGAIPAARDADVAALEARIRGIADRTLVAERARPKLRAVDPSFDATAASVAAYMPDAPLLAAPSSLEDLAKREVELRKRQVVAEAVSDLYHEVANLNEGGNGIVGAIGGISNPESPRRLITRATDRALEPHAEWFVEWQKAKDPKKNGPKTTYDPFVEIHAAIATSASERDAYNAFGQQQKAGGGGRWRDFAPLDASAFEALGAQLKNEQLRVWSRQIEAAGTAARGLWFDQARQFYVPSSRRETGNFIIDTMDFTSIYTADAATTTDASGQPKPVDASMELDEAKLVHAVLVNEGQIELTSVGPYTKRLRELGNAHENARVFMKWATSESLAGANDAAGYKAAFDTLRAKTDDQLRADLDRLNAFARQAGARPFDPEDLRALLPQLLTPAVRDGAIDANVGVGFAGAKLVLDQYRDFLKVVARLKEKKVMDVLKAARDPGTPEPALTWTATDGGKGEIGLGILRARAGVPAPTPTTAAATTTDALAAADNHAIAKASPVARGTTYTKLKIERRERDWYKLDLKAGETATFTIKFDSKNGAGDLNLSLYGAAGSGPGAVVLATSEGTGDVETIAFSSPVARAVWLRVRGARATVAADYVLEVR